MVTRRREVLGGPGNAPERQARASRTGRAIERLVILLILVGLILVAMLGVNGLRAKADLAACRADLATLDNTAEVFSVQQPIPAFPTTLRDFGPLLNEQVGGEISPDGLSLVKSGYTLRYDPFSGHAAGTSHDGRPCRPQ